MTVVPGQARSRLDPEPVPRRDLLGLASLWSAGCAMLFALAGSLRLPRAAVVSSPSKKFRVALPETINPGEPYLLPGRAVAIFRDAEGVYAVSTVCTHLGCVVKSNPEGFECPCHGSRFAKDGSVAKGPAPQALPWLRISGSGGNWIVDEGATVPPGAKVSV